MFASANAATAIWNDYLWLIWRVSIHEECCVKTRWGQPYRRESPMAGCFWGQQSQDIAFMSLPVLWLRSMWIKIQPFIHTQGVFKRLPSTGNLTCIYIGRYGITIAYISTNHCVVLMLSKCDAFLQNMITYSTVVHGFPPTSRRDNNVKRRLNEIFGFYMLWIHLEIWRMMLISVGAIWSTCTPRRHSIFTIGLISLCHRHRNTDIYISSYACRAGIRWLDEQ